MATPICPTCRAKIDPAKSPPLPFCSDRCRQIDLGRWLGEQYAVPIARHDDEDGEGSPETAENAAEPEE